MKKIIMCVFGILMSVSSAFADIIFNEETLPTENWHQAYLPASGSSYGQWVSYPDASSSFRFPITPGQTYTLYWDTTDRDTVGGIFRVGFAKSDDVPNSNQSVNLFDASGTRGLLSSAAPQDLQSITFQIIDPDIKYLVIQVAGAMEPWNNNDFTKLYNITRHLHLETAQIKIATTKYNETKFSPLNTALANAISVVDTVVSNTITQAGKIATLQTQKQTRPADDTCPAYKQCLLVEDENGKPHWYEITDPFRDFVTPIIANNVNAASSTSTNGYTQLEYIESTGTQWIDTGVTPAQITKIDSKAQFLRTDARQALLGVSNNGSGPWNNFVGINPTSSTSKFRIQWATATVPEERWNVLTDTNLHTFVFDKNALTFTVDNAVDTFADYTIENATGNMYVFGMNNGTQGVDRLVYAKMYYMKLYNGSTLVRDFVPVVENTTGKIGMYDTVGGRFYGNAATSGDDFTPGPIVENDADVPGATWTATWAADATTGVSAGTVNGIARCNNYSSTAGNIITNTTSATFSTLGNICHCKMTSIDFEGSVSETDVAKWVHVDHANGGTKVCLQQCSTWCRGFTTMTARNKPVLSSVL